MTNYKRADHNQEVIVETLRAIGATVKHTSQVGLGFPDIVIGYRGINYLMEIKNKKTYGKLRESQEKFREEWAGKVHTVETPDEALKIIGAVD